MSLILTDVTNTFKREVLVQFDQPNGTVKQGSFFAEFERIPQKEVDDMPEDMTNSELLDRALKGVSGIGRTASEELPPEEQLAFVKNSPECVNAAVTVFFKATRAVRYDEKTSKTRRARG